MTVQENVGQQPLFLRKDCTPVELFELFFDDDVLEMIVNNTISYARQCGNHSFQIDKQSLQIFFALLLLSGYNVLPRRKMYWELHQDVHNEAFAKTMSTNRFDEIMRYFHLSDNSALKPGDKFAKVRPLLVMLYERWLTFCPDEKNLSIDESMIPYYGRHGAKQHIHGKPIRFGFKMWSLTTYNSYIIQADPYQGASTGNTIPELGLGESVVVDLISELPSNKKYYLYFDNLFTSLKLLDWLTVKGFGATGTIRANRTERADLIDPKVLGKNQEVHTATFRMSYLEHYWYAGMTIV